MNNFEAIRKKAIKEWQFLQNSPDPVVYIGMGSCGIASGADEVWKQVHKTIKKEKIKARILKVGCIGPCYLEPFLDIQKPGFPRVSFNNVDGKRSVKLIAEFINGNESGHKPLGHFGSQGKELDGIKSFWDQPMLKNQERVVLRNCGIIDPENINHYIARDGFTGLLQAFDRGYEGVIEEIKKSGLRGRGGAGFPTYKKWQLCREAKGSPKYLICNADEVTC